MTRAEAIAFVRDEDTRLIERLSRQLLDVNQELELERARRAAAELEIDELHRHIAAQERCRRERHG